MNSNVIRVKSEIEGLLYSKVNKQSYKFSLGLKMKYVNDGMRGGMTWIKAGK